MTTTGFGPDGPLLHADSASNNDASAMNPHRFMVEGTPWEKPAGSLRSPAGLKVIERGGWT